MTHLSRLFAVCLALGLSGCGDTSSPFGENPNPSAQDTAGSEAIGAPIVLEEDEPEIVLGSGGATPDALDTTSATELAEAANASRGNALGETVASLGDPTQQGLFLRTPLVAAETPGRVQAANGRSLAVTLIPIEGPSTAGSQLSIGAMRGLGLGLTDLPKLQVFRLTASG